MRTISAAVIAATILTACTQGFAPPDALFAGTPTATSSFLKSFESGLVSAGLSADDASFIASKSSARVGTGTTKAGLSSKNEDWGSIGEASMKHALGAISSYSHFPTVADKAAALDAVTTAHFNALSTRVSISELASVIGRVAEVQATEIDETGLSGSDLEAAVKSQATAFMTALIASGVSSEFHSNVIKTFMSGSVRGIGSNPTLAGATSALISAITNGTLEAVGGDHEVLTDDAKGLLVRELLQGVMDGLDHLPNLNTTDRAGLFSDAAGSAQATLVNFAPTLV
ncbi:MAG: hypothetical protein AAB250_19075, partial [Bdellovibrionota bacterium]